MGQAGTARQGKLAVQPLAQSPERKRAKRDIKLTPVQNQLVPMQNTSATSSTVPQKVLHQEQNGGISMDNSLTILTPRKDKTVHLLSQEQLLQEESVNHSILSGVISGVDMSIASKKDQR